MKTIRLYTDGACAGNPGRGGWSAIAFNEDGDNIMQTGAGFRHTTNNRMEILAVAEGISALKKQLDTRDTDIKVTVCSDSQLVVNTFNKGWKPGSNLDIWEKVNEAIDEFPGEITFEKVKGHSNDERNNLADEVAVTHSKPENATGIDAVYENISGFMAKTQNKATETASKDEDDVDIYYPEVVEIRLKNANVKALRQVQIELSNGTTVIIDPCWGGFQQYNCTTAEAALTVDIA